MGGCAAKTWRDICGRAGTGRDGERRSWLDGCREMMKKFMVIGVDIVDNAVRSGDSSLKLRRREMRRKERGRIGPLVLLC